MTHPCILITGSSSGIGYQTARELAKDPHRKIVLHARDIGKANAATYRLRQERPAAVIEGVGCDLECLNSVNDFCSRLQDNYGTIDVLINNAGVMACPHLITKDGYELQFQVNHLSHYLITQKVQPARAIHVSSAAHLFGFIDYTDPCFLNRPYDRWKAYAQSKLAQVLFSAALSKTGAMISNSIHPGIAPTKLVRHLAPLYAKEEFWMPVKAAQRSVMLARDEGTITGLHVGSPTKDYTWDDCERLCELSQDMLEKWL